jgi:hypothetical protein
MQWSVPKKHVGLVKLSKMLSNRINLHMTGVARAAEREIMYTFAPKAVGLSQENVLQHLLRKDVPRPRSLLRDRYKQEYKPYI